MKHLNFSTERYGNKASGHFKIKFQTYAHLRQPGDEVCFTPNQYHDFETIWKYFKRLETGSCVMRKETNALGQDVIILKQLQGFEPYDFTDFERFETEEDRKSTPYDTLPSTARQSPQIARA